MMRQVLFVGGQVRLLLPLKEALYKEPYELVLVENVHQAQAHLATHPVGAVIAEENLAAASGADFLAEVRRTYPGIVRIMITGPADATALIDAVNNAEVYRFLTHPIAASHLARVLREALLISRVAEAQTAVWNAAKQQQDAMQRLLQPDALNAEQAAEAVVAARFVGVAPDAEPGIERIGELSREHTSRLSAREKEIVEALSTGRRVKEIAQDLVISTHTVRNHLKAIYRKLNVRSQFELISLMARHSKDA